MYIFKYSKYKMIRFVLKCNILKSYMSEKHVSKLGPTVTCKQHDVCLCELLVECMIVYFNYNAFDLPTTILGRQNILRIGANQGCPRCLVTLSTMVRRQRKILRRGVNL